MEADFDRFYRRDLAETIWIDEWPASKIACRVRGLPLDSAYVTSITKGHTVDIEALAQIRDRLDVMARGKKLTGEHKPFTRPGSVEKEPVTLSTADGARRLASFFRV